MHLCLHEGTCVSLAQKSRLTKRTARFAVEATNKLRGHPWMRVTRPPGRTSVSHNKKACSSGIIVKAEHDRYSKIKRSSYEQQVQREYELDF